MLCSAAFIPCDSIHEVAMANRLTREQREFIKPLRMGGDEEVLTDTSQPVHVEVYGMNGLPAYEARKLEKAAARRRNGIQAVEWNVDRDRSTRSPCPPQPASQQLDFAGTAIDWKPVFRIRARR
jgi:hypothetical protein